MIRPNKRQRLTEGAFIEIMLDQYSYTYGRILPKSIVAFYEFRTKDKVDIEKIRKMPILFKIAVMNNAITSGRWRIIGKLPLEEELKVLPDRFIQDPLNPNVFKIYRNGKILPSTREEVEGLERAAAWDAIHVEERLRDHYDGKPNKWVESLKIRQ